MCILHLSDQIAIVQEERTKTFVDIPNRSFDNDRPQIRCTLSEHLEIEFRITPTLFSYYPKGNATAIYKTIRKQKFQLKGKY